MYGGFVEQLYSIIKKQKSYYIRSRFWKIWTLDLNVPWIFHTKNIDTKKIEIFRTSSQGMKFLISVIYRWMGNLILHFSWNYTCYLSFNGELLTAKNVFFKNYTIFWPHIVFHFMMTLCLLWTFLLLIESKTEELMNVLDTHRNFNQNLQKVFFKKKYRDDQIFVWRV